MLPSCNEGPREPVVRRVTFRRPNLSNENYELCDADQSLAPFGRMKKVVSF